MVDIKKLINFSKIGLIKQICFANLFTSQLPFKITFALTYKCNLRCKYCRIWEKPPKEELSLDKVKLIFNSMPYLKWVHLTGGEIFMREDIEDLLNFIVKNNKFAIINLPTNGFLTSRILDILTPLSKKLKGTRLIITCSINGIRQTHDKLVGVDGAYDRCIETFIRLRETPNITACIGVTISGENRNEIPLLFSEVRDRIPGFAFRELHFNFLNKSFFYNNTALDFPDEINKESYSSVKNIRKLYKNKGIKDFLENRYFGVMGKYLSGENLIFKCSAADASCFIDPYGDVYPCINYETKIGNLGLLGYDFIKFWKLSNALARNKIRENCPRCWTPCEAYPTILKNFVAQRQ